MVRGRFNPTHRLAIGALAAGAVLAAGVLWAGSRLTRLEVEGQSMTPTLLPGDRLLVARTGPLRVGDLVALRDPRRPDRLLVKRVGEVVGDRIVVAGDNPAASTDSRTFGPVPVHLVVGRPRYRYAPPGRVGRLGRARQEGRSQSRW